MNSWKILESLLRENKQYRGASSVTMKDINALLVGDPKRPGITGVPGDPQGGAVDCEHPFSASIWKGWYPSRDTALATAASDKDVTNQYAGRAQGGTTVKNNWGGLVHNQAGKARTDFESLPSTMDRYDVYMQGQVNGDKGVMTRFVYSPSIGSSEERKARLMALMAGQAPAPLSRRPQPERPEPSRQDVERWDAKHPQAQPVRRQGQNLKAATNKKSED